MKEDAVSEATKALALKWFEALVEGDTKTAFDMMHPDFRYFLPGNMPCSGWTDRKGFADTAVIMSDMMAGPMSMQLGDVVAEGDRVFIEAQGDALLKTGQRYQNVYVMALRVRDGQIAELKEFCDSLHTYQVMDHPGVRGPSKPRERHLDRVSRTLEGVTIAKANA
jgi:ketosteroid isomerase-like protein